MTVYLSNKVRPLTTTKFFHILPAVHSFSSFSECWLSESNREFAVKKIIIWISFLSELAIKNQDSKNLNYISIKKNWKVSKFIINQFKGWWLRTNEVNIKSSKIKNLNFSNRKTIFSNDSFGLSFSEQNFNKEKYKRYVFNSLKIFAWMAIFK